MNLISVIEWIAVIVGMCGNLLWSTNSKYSKWSAPLWFIGSLLWIWFAIYNKHAGLATSNVVSASVYFFGIWRWIFDKKRTQCNLRNNLKESVILNNSN